MLEASQTPSEFFNLPVIGTITTSKQTLKGLGGTPDMVLNPETYAVIKEEDTFYVCNQWYKEHKKVPQLISKIMVKKFKKK